MLAKRNPSGAVKPLLKMALTPVAGTTVEMLLVVVNVNGACTTSTPDASLATYSKPSAPSVMPEALKKATSKPVMTGALVVRRVTLPPGTTAVTCDCHKNELASNWALDSVM